MNNEKNVIAIHWFRHGLRLHDNPSLLSSLKDCSECYLIFIFDGFVAGTGTSGFNRFRFLHESLQSLDESLKKVGGRLYVFKGNAVKILKQLFEEWDITRLTFEQETEQMYRQRDNEVRRLCSDCGVECVEKTAHTLWDPWKIIEVNGGKPPLTFAEFNDVVEMIGPPPKPVVDPDFSGISLPVPDDFDKRFVLPSLNDLGVQPEDENQLNRKYVWVGGETKALELLKSRLAHEKKAFEEGVCLPNQYSPDLVGAPLSMSAHLRFGCLSVRKFYWAVHNLFSKVTDEVPHLGVTGQLMWREYFYTMCVNNENYSVMKDNPICLNIEWSDNNEHFEKWTQGETGFPWIDALMKQLKEEGWIHHVGRHAVACFLTRGDLWINWERGLEVFLKYIIDADVAVSGGNWMWVSSSAFENALQCPRCYCPVRYGMAMDPTGEFVRRYLPVLKDMPLKYLFQPWRAPRAVQEKANCIVGVDYPQPMVDHKAVSTVNMKRMKELRDLLHEKVPPHCAPSGAQEISEFSWLGRSENRVCTGGFDCQRIHVDSNLD
ncbi:cryptochrome-1-like [Tubulanus polymorphus]|uniref:cryptochrome-1-like n=1 Tax=Tubulanus polymorphus TaxID=672921 RepID=UPI003DA48E88